VALKFSYFVPILSQMFDLLLSLCSNFFVPILSYFCPYFCRKFPPVLSSFLLPHARRRSLNFFKKSVLDTFFNCYDRDNSHSVRFLVGTIFLLFPGVDSQKNIIVMIITLIIIIVHNINLSIYLLLSLYLCLA
jgi:hypothetical protein